MYSSTEQHVTYYYKINYNIQKNVQWAVAVI